MAVETDAERAIFFNTDDFGVVATITPNDGPAFDVPGHFDQPHLTSGVRQDNGYRGGQAQISGGKPTFRGLSSALANVKNGRATLLIKDGDVEIGTFTAFDVKPDGYGNTIIQLMKA